jgi:hypothetical protein
MIVCDGEVSEIVVAPARWSLVGAVAGRHTPALQLCPMGQALAQRPQLLASVCTFTQRPEQVVVPAGHAHAPAVQRWPFMHAVPQRPQLELSVMRFTQAVTMLVVHDVVPAAQPQRPAAQV